MTIQLFIIGKKSEMIDIEEGSTIGDLRGWVIDNKGHDGVFKMLTRGGGEPVEGFELEDGDKLSFAAATVVSSTDANGNINKIYTQKNMKGANDEEAPSVEPVDPDATEPTPNTAEEVVPAEEVAEEAQPQLEEVTA